MYTKKFWDTVYKFHINDAPWMSYQWTQESINIINKYIIYNPSDNLSLLDFGCGNGSIAYNFYKKGFDIELAEISHKLVIWLRKKYNINKINIYEIESPKEIINKKYNFIISWGVFHHIKPSLWSKFLDEFHDLMTRSGILIIGGWDISDEVLKSENMVARYTGGFVWFINTLKEYINENKFVIIENKVSSIFLPPFNIDRKFRYYVLLKK